MIKTNLFLKVLVLMVVIFPSAHLQAEEGPLENIKDYLRPYMEELLGKDTTEKILGTAESTIRLPKIPEVNSDSTSTASHESKIKGEKEISAELRGKHNYTFLKEVHEVTLDREPSEDDYSKWMNTLEQGASREGIYRALVLSSSYEALEKFQNTPSDRLINFTMEFLRKYINLKVDKDALLQLNLYSIKRVCVEKSLEVIDVLARDPDSLYDWYAVLSGELAKDFARSLPEGIRKDPSLENQRRWAVSVPLEYIKSEVIIKLHRVFNSLP